MAIYGESLYDLIGKVKDIKPNAPRDTIVRAINKRIRSVTTRRSWSDLLAITTVNFPAPYNTGTIELVSASNIVVGDGTAWPSGDFISTTAASQFNQVKQPGYAKVTPASMARIIPGQWLYCDRAGGNPEAVAVVSVSSDSFIAKYSYPHNTGFTIEASSFAGLQLQPAYPLYTITAVIDEATLLIDQNWGGPTLTQQAYNILRGYVQPDPDCWRIKFANDPVQGIALDVERITYEQILISDPQLTTSDNPTLVAATPFLGGGQVPQWLVYPLVFQAYYLNMIIVKAWPKLINDLDRSPGFLNSDLFVSGAKADVLRQKIMADKRDVDPYYDLTLAQHYEQEFQGYLEIAEEHDESLSHHRLQSFEILATGSYSATYLQSHIGAWPSNFPWGSVG